MTASCSGAGAAASPDMHVSAGVAAADSVPRATRSPPLVAVAGSGHVRSATLRCRFAVDVNSLGSPGTIANLAGFTCGNSDAATAAFFAAFTANPAAYAPMSAVACGTAPSNAAWWEGVLVVMAGPTYMTQIIVIQFDSQT